MLRKLFTLCLIPMGLLISTEVSAEESMNDEVVASNFLSDPAEDPMTSLANAIRSLGLTDDEGGEQSPEEIICDFSITMWDHLLEIKTRFPNLSDLFKFMKNNPELFQQIGLDVDGELGDSLDQLIELFERREQVYFQNKSA